MVALLHPQTHQPASRPRRLVDPQPGSDRHLSLVPGGRAPHRREVPTSGSFAAWLAQLDRRVIGVLGAVVVAYLALSLLQSGPPANTGSPIESQTVSELQAGESIVVAISGDTYWQIASTLVAEGDIRPVVQQLVERNGGANLEIGQRVIIPAAFG